MGYFFKLAARVLLYASPHRQDNAYHGLCYTSRGALDGTTKDGNALFNDALNSFEQRQKQAPVNIHLYGTVIVFLIKTTLTIN